MHLKHRKVEKPELERVFIQKGQLNTCTCIVPQSFLLSFPDLIVSEGPALIDDNPVEDSSSSELEPDLLIPTNLVFFTLLGVVGGTDAAACGMPFRAPVTTCSPGDSIALHACNHGLSHWAAPS